MSDTQTPAAPADEARIAAALDGWKRKLLDLTRRNRALDFRLTRASTVAAAAVLVLSSCESSPTDSTPTVTSLSAEYRLGGEAWRSYSVVGHQPPGTPRSTPGEWVHMVAGYDRLWLRAQELQSDGTWNEFDLLTDVLAQGDSLELIEPLEVCNGGLPCADLNVVINGTRVGEAPREVCTIADGILVITRSTETWVSGSFSGSGACTVNSVQTRQIGIRNGRFDAEISRAAPNGGG